MNFEEIDEESREKRKKEVVEYRTKKRNSLLFMCAASVFEIVETILLMLVLFVLFSFVIFKVLHLSPDVAGTVFGISSVVIFIGGMILGFLIYKRVITWIIEKFNMKDKLSNDVIMHYQKKSKDETEMELIR